MLSFEMSNQLPQCCDHAGKVKYIGSLELGEHRYGLPENHTDVIIELDPDNVKDSCIIGGGVAIFTENVKGRANQDILNATLLAQLAANKQHDRERNTKDW